MNALHPTTATVTFDARPTIAQGGEPLDAILDLSATLDDGDVLEIIAPFDPQPLYAVLRARGYRTPITAVERAPGEWSTRFTRVDITPTQTVADVQFRHPDTAPVFAGFGLDACCGGGHSIEFAAGAHGVDLHQLLTSLQTVALAASHTET